MSRSRNNAPQEQAGLPPASAEPQRTVAFVVKSLVVAFHDTSTRLLGGELVTEPRRVEALRGNDGVEFLEVPESAVEELRQTHAQAVENLREHAAKLGFVVFRDGEIDPVKARRR